MSKLRHQVASFAIMAVLIGLLVTVWGGFRHGYDLSNVEDRLGSTNTSYHNMTVMEALDGLLLMEGVSKATEGVTRITSPTETFDLLGGLAAAGIGLLQTIGGVLAFPYQITTIINSFYGTAIPPALIQLIVVLAGIYIFFIILNAYVKSEGI